ncbi:MAG TPA: EamA family transporter [Opitutaceae bacterium]|nr:EamA family transporter [Opitutaceae bacterium]
MPYLLAVSLLWAFSFGLTKGLTAGLDGTFVAAARLAFALAVFLPFFRWRGLGPRLAGGLAALGAVQFGLMYLAYNESFRHLQAYEVALLTLTTPILVTLLADALDRRFRPRALAAALLAVAGTAVVVFSGSSPLAPTAAGVLLVQASNLAFAAGQVSYRRIRLRHPALRDHEIFALPYAGAFALAAAAALVRTDLGALALSSQQWLTLAYLGLVASGLGFFLWNLGATRAAAGTLAVMNNAKVPLGVACSLLFFGESAAPVRLTASLALLAVAVWLAEAGNPPPESRAAAR